MTLMGVPMDARHFFPKNKSNFIWLFQNNVR